MIAVSGYYGNSAQEYKTSSRVLGFQVAITLICAGVAYSMEAAPQFALAVLCGGGISVANGVLLAWRMSRAASHITQDAQHQLRLLYFYAAERFLVVVVLLAISMTVIKLQPPALLGGFVMAQAAMIVARLFLNRSKDD